MVQDEDGWDYTWMKTPRCRRMGLTMMGGVKGTKAVE